MQKEASGGGLVDAGQQGSSSEQTLITTSTALGSGCICTCKGASSQTQTLLSFPSQAPFPHHCLYSWAFQYVSHMDEDVSVYQLELHKI